MSRLTNILRHTKSLSLLAILLLAVSFWNWKVRTAEAAGVPTFAPAPAGNATLFVTNTNDSGPGSLRAAVITANSDTVSDTIVISATGTITLQTALPAFAERSVIIEGPGAVSLRVRRNGIPGFDTLARYSIFIVNEGVTVTIKDLTLSHGWSAKGGGIYNAGTLTLTNCVVSDSQADVSGAGIYNESTGTLTLNNTTVSNNTERAVTDGSQGGGIANFGQAVLITASISANRARSGAGIYNDVQGNLTISNSHIDSNVTSVSGERGGGMLNAGTLTISHSTIQGNSAYQGAGVMILQGSASVTISDSTISNNEASTVGGGVAIVRFSGLPENLTQIEFQRVTISSNVADQEAGGLSNGGNVKLDNCTVSDNQSANAAIMTKQNSTTIINQSTVAKNRTNDTGGGLDCTLAPATIRGSIISGHNFRDIRGTIVSNDFNLLGQGANNLKPHDIVATDPKLTALGNHGGSVQTHALMSDSPAIDHGPTSDLLPTDARNFLRPVDADGDGLAVSDIGAFETQAYVVTNTNNSGNGSLRQALLANNSAGGGFITFNIPGSGVHTITPTSDTLLEITKPVYLAGYSQPGASRNTATVGNNASIMIEVSGAMAGFGSTGLYVTSDYSVIEGLVINGFSGDSGIWISGALASHNRISGNRIGTDASGTMSRPNYYGIVVSSGQQNIIGTNTDGRNDLSEGNLLSGNVGGGVAIFQAFLNRIAGNYIGVDVSGQLAIPNTGNGISLNDSDTTIIGADSAVTRNLISGNTQNGISIEGPGSKSNFIMGNFIGTNANGTLAISNRTGIHVFNGSNNTIGGTVATLGNVISGNLDGLIIGPDGAANNVVQGNLIGLAANGTSALGNNGPNAGNGVAIIGSSGNLVGDPSGVVNQQFLSGMNRIANNSGPGVYVVSGTTNTVRGNSIFANGSLGIDLGSAGITPNDGGDLDSGANNLQNFPVLNTVIYDGFGRSNTEVKGTFNSTPNTTFSLEFFTSPNCDASGHGEGQTLAGSGNVTTDATGDANFTFNFNSANLSGLGLSATATDPTGNTSEFSSCVAVTLATRSVQFTFDNFSVTEGAIATLTVSRVGSPGQGVTVNYATANGATNPAMGGAVCGAGVDYVNTTGTISWGDNDLTNKTVNIPICNNDVVDSPRNIGVTLSNPTNGSSVGIPGTATVTILDNDDPGEISFASSINIAREGYGTADIKVARTAADGGPVSVQYATVSGGSAVGGSSCSANVDYVNSTGTVSWAANDISPKFVKITLCDDSLTEPDKTVAVSLSNPTGGASLGSTPTTTVNIVDDDHIFTVTNTNDDGPGSLRQALVAANSNEPTDSSHIAFSPSLTGTINLLTALPDLNANIFIHGPRANLLTVARSTAPGTPEFGIFHINSGRTASIGGLTIRNGLAIDGGGIYNEGAADIQGCNIEGNTATDGGGGIANVGTMTLNASTISNNQSFFTGNITGGGGIYNYGDLSITSSTVSGNHSNPNGHGFGGGIFNDGNGPIVLTNSTVTGNTASHAGNNTIFDQSGGGGIYQRFFPGQTFTITNSIIAGNSCPNAQDISGPIVSGDYNLIGNTSFATFTGATSHNLTNVDALLAPLADNGGPTPTHALLSGSPAIDAGNNQNAPTRDQRGLQRIADGNNDGSQIIDIGAFEVQSSCSMVLVTETLPSARAGSTYHQALEVSGGTPGFTFSVTSGALPNGLALSSDGQLFGTPTQTGSFTFEVTVGDVSGCSRHRSYTLSVNCSAITIGPDTLPSGSANSPYPTTSLTAVGSGGLYTFVLLGTLPSGLTFSGSTFSGTPTQDGQFPLIVTATDENGCTASRSYTIQIVPAPPVCASDVTPLLAIVRSGFSQNLITRRFRQTVTIRNDGGQPILGPLVYAVDNLSLNAALYNPSGITACAVPISPYMSISTSPGQLLPGQSVTLILEFTNSNTRESITYTPRILAGNAR